MAPSLRFFRFLTVAVFVLAIGFGAAALFNLSHAGQAPWEDRVPFYFPFLTAVDQKGRSYVSDSATRRIVALDKDGSLRWELHGGKRKAGFYYAHGLAVDASDRLYVYNFLPLPGSDYKAQEIQIQRYNLDGTLEKTVFRLENKNETDDFPVYFGFFIEGDRLFTLLGDGQTIRMTGFSLDGEGESVIRTLPAPADFVAVTGTSDGRVAGAARDGSLWEAEAGQNWKKISWPELQKPWDVKYQSDGRLLVLDLREGSIRRREADGSSTLLLSSSQTKGVFADTIALAPNRALAVADKDLQRLLVSTSPGQYTAYQGALLSSSDTLLKWTFWVCVAAAVFLGLAGLLLSYFFLADRRLPLLFIQLVFFVPIIILVQGYADNRVYDSLFQRYRDQVRNTLLNAANLGAHLIPGGDVQALNLPSDFGSPAYDRLKVAAKAVQKAGQESGAFGYVAIYRQIDGQPYYVYTGSGTFGVDYPYTLLPADAKKLFETSGRVYAEYFDDYGVYDAAFASLAGPDGKPIGVIEVGRFADLAKDTENAYLAGAIRIALISGGLFVVIFVVLTLLLIRSLGSLRRMTREIAGGQLEITRPLTDRDEFGQLSRDFETMSSRLSGYLRDITALTSASARFVPKDFIDLLGEEDLTQLRLGDQTSREMTVMFSSVLNFRKITGQMSPQGMFQYLNSYLETVVPHVRDHHGVIDKYIGDTYMALFPRVPVDALKAWKQIQRKVAVYNQRRARSGSEPLSVSFGMHLGPLMLGIVGEHERMEGTVISDAVNLTSRLNGLCRVYGVPCVVSRSTLQSIAGGPEDERAGPFRPLDFVAVKGKTEPLLVCQPFDIEDKDSSLLLAWLPLYEAAFADWEAGRVADALKKFEELEYRLPDDRVVRRHAERCRGLLKTGLPEVWSPAVKVTEK